MHSSLWISFPTQMCLFFFFFLLLLLLLLSLLLLLLLLFTQSFSHQPMVFHWSLSDSKFPQVSRTLLSILAVLNNAVVWMASTRLPISKSSSPFSNPLVTVPNAPMTIGIIVTCMFHSFFQFPSKVEVLILLFTFFQFYSVVSRDNKVDYFASSLFFLLLIIIKSGLLAGIRWLVLYVEVP